MSEAAYPELLDTDLTSFHIEGFFTDDGAPFRVPLISHVVGNLWQGGCVDGMRLPDDFEFVVGLTNSQHYVLGPDTVRVEVVMDDSPIVPDRKSLVDLARVTSAFCAKGKTLVHCTPPGTVTGSAVPSTIESPSSVVIGLDGKEHQVEAAITHRYDGDLVHIRARGIPPFSATPDHQFLVYRPYRYPSGFVRKANYATQKSTRDHVREYDSRQPEWVYAADLQPHDALLSPYWTPIAKVEAIPFSEKIEDPRERAIRIPSLDADTAWLFGLYAGDGYTMGANSFGLTLSREGDVKRATEALSRFGRPVTVRDHGPYQKLRVDSTSLTRQFADACGRSSSEKHIPDWLMRSQFRYEALAGVMAADGHKRRDRNGYSLRVTSQMLAWQAWHLVVAQGHRPSLSPLRRSSGYPNARPIWDVTWTPGGKHHRTFHWHSYYGMPIIETRREPYVGTVHTLTVPEGESYLTNGAISHNCQAGFNRSGLIAGLALVLDGMAPVDAIALMRAQRSPLVLCNPVFENWLLSYGQAG